MRFEFLLFYLLLISASCNNTGSTSKPTNSKEEAKVIPRIKQPSATLLSYDHLIGYVKSMSQSTFHATKKKNNIQKVMLGNAYSTNYDKDGNGIEKNYFNSAMKLQTRTTYEVDKTKKRIRAIVYGPTKSILKTIKYTYDIQSNLIEETSFKPNKVILSNQKYKYDILGNLKEETKFIGLNQFDIKTTYTYNNLNQIIETKYFRPENRMIILCKTSYSQFDQHGNWLKSIEQTNKGSIFIVERKINYYE